MTSLVKLRDAYLEQWDEFRRWCGSMDATVASQSSAITGWSVLDLVAHFALVAETLNAAASKSTSETPISTAEYIATYADVASAIDDETRSHSGDVVDVLAELDRRADDAHRVLHDPTLDYRTVVRPRRGPIRWGDFVTTRCIELAVHVDDLVRSTSAEGGPVVTSPCLQVATRALAQVLAERAPGQSVEVRVPPYAAVQVVPGPRHTRGTPGAVVEMAPVTFVRLAAGRVNWQQAQDAGAVLASGERTDLGPWLPLLG